MVAMRYFSVEELENSASRVDVPKRSLYKGYLRSSNHFIQDMVRSLKLPPGATLSSMVLFLRYTTEMSIVRSDRYMIATAALFLSAKAFEHPKSLSHMIRWMLTCRKPGGNKEAEEVLSDREGQQYTQLAEGLLTLEHQMLVLLGFDVLNLPDAYTVFLRTWNANSHLQMLHQQHRERAPFAKEQRDKNPQLLLQTAWSFVNDSCSTTLPIQFPLEVLVYGCIASVLHVLSLPTEDSEGRPWYEATWPNADVQGINKVRKTLLKQYSNTNVVKQQQKQQLSACGASAGPQVPIAAFQPAPPAAAPEPSSPGSGEPATTGNALGSKRPREEDGVVDSTGKHMRHGADVPRHTHSRVPEIEGRSDVAAEGAGESVCPSPVPGTQPEKEPERLESGEIEPGEIVS